MKVQKKTKVRKRKCFTYSRSIGTNKIFTDPTTVITTTVTGIGS
ncbi:MAG: hypothetical protein Q8N05_17095 [Bacteroidota bacterium]|nr:hypothetical protein [Bacteroidota bacterium]